MRGADRGGVPGLGEPGGVAVGSDGPSSDDGEAGILITLTLYTTGFWHSLNRRCLIKGRTQQPVGAERGLKLIYNRLG